MEETRTGTVVRAGLFTLWGLATLILAACLGLLLYDRVEQGDSPLEITFSNSPEPDLSTPTAADITLTPRQVSIYFADHQGVRLDSELRRVPCGDDTVENCRRALRALIEGPQGQLTPVVPPSTKIRGMYTLDGGELVVDFSRDMESGQVNTASAELLMVRAIVSTVVQPRLRGEGDRPLRRVRFLFEGSPPQDMFPAHIDLTEPVAFEREWIADNSGSAADV